MSRSENLSIFEAMEQAAGVLRSQSDTFRQDASVLLAQIMQQSRTWIAAHPEVILSTEQKISYARALEKLADGVPLPYILGFWEFYGLDFIVTPDVLIPRPETELLVTSAIEWLTVHPARKLVADIGTGSGCIAISLAVNLPDLTIFATDLSAGAVSIARRNIRRHAVEDRLTLIQGDLVDGLPQPVDVLCANLPYIPTHELEKLRVSKHEPSLALDGGADGLVVIKRLLNLVPGYVMPGGLILLEMESNQGRQVEMLAKTQVPNAEIEIRRDLAGYDRLVSIELTSLCPGGYH